MFMIAAARAADVSYSSAQGLSFISITGPIVEGDSDKFNQLAASMTGPVVIALESFRRSTAGRTSDRRGYPSQGPLYRRLQQIPMRIDLWLDLACWQNPIHRHFWRSQALCRLYCAAAMEAKYEIGSGGWHHRVSAYLTKLGLSLQRSFIRHLRSSPDGMSWLQPRRSPKRTASTSLRFPIPSLSNHVRRRRLRLHRICWMDRRWNAR